MPPAPPPRPEALLLRALHRPNPDWLSIIPLVQSAPPLSKLCFTDPTLHRPISALHAAAASFSPLYTALLLARGASPNTRPYPPLLACAAAPLRPAREAAAAAVIRILLAAGADARVMCGEDGCAMDALGHAVVARSVERVRALVQGGAAVNVRYRNGSSALHVAAATGVEGVVRALVEGGASVDVLDFVGGGGGRTPADCAYAEGFVEVGDWLKEVHAGQKFRYVRE